MTAIVSTQKIQDLFRPLIGQMAWNVRGGHGSFLTFEFGEPHISVRDPIVPRPNSSARAQRNLKRRQVSIVGDWHFFVQYCDWRISVAEGSLDSNAIASSHDECLADLQGQRLVAVASGSMPHSWKFEFDLGGLLEIQPSAAYELTDDMWSLHRWNGDISAVQNDGTVVFEKAAIQAD